MGDFFEKQYYAALRTLAQKVGAKAEIQESVIVNKIERLVFPEKTVLVTYDFCGWVNFISQKSVPIFRIQLDDADFLKKSTEQLRAFIKGIPAPVNVENKQEVKPTGIFLDGLTQKVALMKTFDILTQSKNEKVVDVENQKKIQKKVETDKNVLIKFLYKVRVNGQCVECNSRSEARKIKSEKVAEKIGKCVIEQWSTKPKSKLVKTVT